MYCKRSSFYQQFTGVKLDKELSEKFKNLRDKIDAVDIKIVKLLNIRALYAIKLGAIKKIAGLPIYMPEREKEVNRNVLKNNNGPLEDKAVSRLYERIIDESRRLERKKNKENEKNN